MLNSYMSKLDGGQTGGSGYSNLTQLTGALSSLPTK